MSATAGAVRVETENVVVSTEIDQELDLEAVAGDLPDTEYDPDEFPGIAYQVEEPTATVLLFRSGKIIGTGAASVDDARASLDVAFDTLRELGLQVPDDPEAQIENIVSTSDLEQRLNLNAIALGVGLEHVEYEPEQFPGLVYRLPDPDAAVLLFGSGKVVITGCRTTEQAEAAIDTVIDEIADLGLLDDT